MASKAGQDGYVASRKKGKGIAPKKISANGLLGLCSREQI
jgi:hypothetical protein